MQYDAYYDYLSKRSLPALIYRWYYLYPRFNKYLPGKVLDYGCGIGDFLRFRKDTIGVDINPHNVEHCQKKNQSAQVIEVDKPLPFDDESFDSVLIDNVLEHVLDPTSIMTEVERVCKKGGRLLLSVPGEKGFAHDPDHKLFYREHDLGKLCEQFGFSSRCYFYTPWKSKLLDKYVYIYALHGVYEKTGTAS